MTAARANAPTLAWLLAALTCLLVGLAVGESWRTEVAPSAAHLGDEVETVAVAGGSPTPAATCSPREAGTPSTTLLFESAPVRLAAGPARLQVARLAVPPGVELSAEAAPGPAVLLVETGALAVPDDGVAGMELGLASPQNHLVLRAGQRLVVAPGERYTVRNDGPTPAVALLVAIVPG